MAQQSRGEESRRTVCPPNGMTASDAINAVLKRSRVASTATGVGASGFVAFAMEDAFPCAGAAGLHLPAAQTKGGSR